MSDSGEITKLLKELAEDESADQSRAVDSLVPLLYRELKVLARSNRYRWRGGFSPGTTSLVHEAYARLAKQDGVTFDNRRQFFALASRVMRSILIDNARRHQARKRNGATVPLTEETLVSVARSDELLELDEALVRLESSNGSLARVVECRCFGGLTVEETAEALEISSATVKRRFRVARAWLYSELKPATITADPSPLQG